MNIVMLSGHNLFEEKKTEVYHIISLFFQEAFSILGSTKS